MVWVLNLEWVVLATAMSWLWARHARLKGPGRQVQFIALALILVNMFVVISMYDDMAMAQSPAETSCFAREDFSGARAHALLHPVANFPQPLFSEPSFATYYLGVVGNYPAPALQSPALGSIQNRPPPAA
ncbi:MAG: hypothetical protein ABR957_00800 [Terracidiphilus sp.]|jgi:hypothetical protein